MINFPYHMKHPSYCRYKYPTLSLDSWIFLKTQLGRSAVRCSRETFRAPEVGQVVTVILNFSIGNN